MADGWQFMGDNALFNVAHGHVDLPDHPVPAMIPGVYPADVTYVLYLGSDTKLPCAS